MLTIINYEDAESLIKNGNEEFRLNINPGIFSRIQLYLTGKVTKGVQIFGVGPFAMKHYLSLLEYSRLVGKASEKGYKVYIIKDGSLFNKGDWYIEFKF
jgi:hypothetical protein